MAQAPRPTVFYNSACPVCDAGVCAMRDRLPGGSVEWVDVHRHPEALLPLGLDLETVRERLHMVGADGQMQVGSDVLASAWARVPRWGWLAAPLRWPWSRPLGRHLYNTFARHLYRWNRSHGHW